METRPRWTRPEWSIPARCGPGAPPDDGPDARQARYWNSPATAPWVALQERLDALFAPLSRAALDRAAPVPGEAALDVGCGCGATVLELARHVGLSGRVHGVDISAQMLGRAKERVAAGGLANVALTLADAATGAFPPAGFDLAFSRLGVMFFGAPALAFATLRRALKPSGGCAPSGSSMQRAASRPTARPC